MADPIYVVGALLQVTGCGATGIGAWRTWQQYADEGFWDFVTVPARRVATSVTLRVRRLFGKPRVTGMAGTAFGHSTAKATLSVRRSDIPTGVDLDAAIGYINQRLNDLHTSIEAVEQRHAKDTDEATQSLREMRKWSEGELLRLEGISKHVAVGALRLQAGGLTMIAVGVLMQLLAS